ncbi:Hemimethylated DNA-binding protein YccV like-domain-containing protein [Aspergillus karnatakaensis]|uniref:Hemimethylated DNA-binding protein YccV like-domain-containing protein n=1 Tax=Aspergillus karnatakaensis TaxID=1810916 RepID=UPI003CCE536F
MVLSLSDLPEELLHNILLFCHPLGAASLERTSRRFRGVTNEPLLWNHYCHTHFKYWARGHYMPGKISVAIPNVDWKALYISRHIIDRKISRFLDDILTSQTGRIGKFKSVVNFGYDAKDTLLRNISVEPGADDHLARSYYAKALLTCLHRSVAIPEWAILRDKDGVSLANALGAFDLFIPESGFGNFDEINDRLDEIMSGLLIEFPNIHRLSPREKAGAVAKHLRSHNMTGIEPLREYHCLEHNFIGIALDDPGHNSLPLVSAVIYCHIAQKLGLNARPCGFPFHVHVIVIPPTGLDIDGNTLDTDAHGEPIYLDPFRSEKETPVSNLRTQLNFLGASSMEQAAFLGESRTSEIVLRCSKNILNSVQRMSQISEPGRISVDVSSARYAALWSSLLLSNPLRPAELRHHLLWLMELLATDFPSDINLIEQYIAPMFQGTVEFEHIMESLHVIRAVDEIPKQVKRRSPQHKGVSYHVGQVFKHRRYNYTAIITGWDAECGAGEQWMRRMRIDQLQSGRHQSFYHVIVEDKSVRYVAEENVQLIEPDILELPPSLVAVAGKYFKRWDTSARTFVSNIGDEYPDD